MPMLTPDQITRARQADLLALATRYTSLRRVAASRGGEYAGPCPLCGGRDRFHLQPAAGRWFCRRCTGDPQQGGWHDAIELQMRLTGSSFCDAVEALAGPAVGLAGPAVRLPGAAVGLPGAAVGLAGPAVRLPGPHPPAPSGPPVDPSPQPPSGATGGPPGAAWQVRGQALVERAQAALWGPPGGQPLTWAPGAKPLPARDWLAQRGLSESTLRAARVGLVPEGWRDPPGAWGLEGPAVFIAPGVLIPATFQGQLWGLKVRCPSAPRRPKYIQVRGSRPGLYLADSLLGAPETACITEGELDALLLRQALQAAANPRWQRLAVVTPGSCSNRLDLAAWGRWLYPLRRLLLFYDQDGKSGAALAYWQALTARAQVVHWRNLRPGDKDLSDYHRSGGRLLDLVAWALAQAEG